MNDFENTIGEITNNTPRDNFNSALIEPELKDHWQTEQQKLRDQAITKLLRKYVDNYSNKVTQNKKLKNWILIFCGGIISVVVIACITMTFLVVCKGTGKNGFDSVALVSAYASLVGTIVGILKIVTKYVFPEHEEQYITEIVKAIQNNDLENKKVNIGAERKD